MNLKTFISKNIIFIIVFIIFFIAAHYYYFKLDIETNKKFRELMSTYASFLIFLTIYNIYKSGQINYSNIINTQLNSLNSLFQNITQTSSTFFLSKPNMKYYYDELFNGIINKDEIIRDTNLEEIISNNLLTNIDSLINYIDAYKISNGSNFQLEIMEDKLKKILEQFVKSPIFINNWNRFQNILALSWTKTYFSLYFNM
jgi:hypothetical protein